MIKAIVVGFLAHDGVLYKPAKIGEKPVVIELDERVYRRQLALKTVEPFAVPDVALTDEEKPKARRKPAE